MAREQVHAIGFSSAEPEVVWAIARDFCGLWHPALATMQAESSASGALIRAFTAKGEGKTHREQLTYFSDSDRIYDDRHLEGIVGAQSYNTRLTVASAERGGSVITMTAKPGPLVLFLHGIGGGRHNWIAQLGTIGNAARAAALDLRGYGDSTLGPHQSTVDDYYADILRVREVLGADKLVLVGLSYGSWIATSFAMHHPEVLAGLVLSGGCTGMSEAGPEEREAFRVSREVPLNAGQVPADFAPAVVKVLASPNASDTVRQTLLQSMAAIPAATYRDAPICFTNPLERFDFAKLTMPVLMMTGEFDRLAPPAEIGEVAGRILDSARLPDVRFEVIVGAGHVCNAEAPETYSRHLLDFLRKVVG